MGKLLSGELFYMCSGLDINLLMSVEDFPTFKVRQSVLEEVNLKKKIQKFGLLKQIT